MTCAMIDQHAPELWDNFFKLATIGELRNFAAELDSSIPESAALLYYISTWDAFAQSNDNDVFSPTSHLSEDRSAVKYGNAPVVFEGSNFWARKPYLTNTALARQLEDLENLVVQIRASNPHARMTLLLVPEKDHVISRFLRKEDRFNCIERAVEKLSGRLALKGLPVIFTQPFLEIDRYLNLADFEFFDSHLPSRYYVIVFGFVLESIGIPWTFIKDHVGLKQLPEFGDLSIKFSDRQPSHVLAFQPDVHEVMAHQVAGTASFGDPLGETLQEFHNEKAIVDQSVCILGDSHSSIFSQRKLTYLFASTFKDTHFEWNPCGVRKMPDVAKYQNVVLEISIRFVV